MRCDVIAQGIVKAGEELDIKIPIVVRLQGKCSQLNSLQAAKYCKLGCIYIKKKYSRTSMARTLMARLPQLFQTGS